MILFFCVAKNPFFVRRDIWWLEQNKGNVNGNFYKNIQTSRQVTFYRDKRVHSEARKSHSINILLYHPVATPSNRLKSPISISTLDIINPALTKFCNTKNNINKYSFYWFVRYWHLLCFVSCICVWDTRLLMIQW